MVSDIYLSGRKNDMEGYISSSNRYHVSVMSESESNFLNAGFFGFFYKKGRLFIKKMLHWPKPPSVIRHTVLHFFKVLILL